MQQRARNCSKVHAARAARLYDLIQPNKFFIFVIVVAVTVVDV